MLSWKWFVTSDKRQVTAELLLFKLMRRLPLDYFHVFCLFFACCQVTGKTPKFDREDNEYAIMFHVGGGGRPKIPENLTTDCKDFLDHCFEKDPQVRWKAEKLLNHPFVTVDIGDIQI